MPRSLNALRRKMDDYQANRAELEAGPLFPGLRIDLNVIWRM